MAVLLNSGKVFIAGGGTQAVAKTTVVYDPNTGNFTPAASTVDSHWGASLLLLKDGTVLMAAGDGPGMIYAFSYIYNPIADSWLPTMGDLTTARAGMASALMKDGRAILIGGEGYVAGFLQDAEIYDPATGYWTTTPLSSSAHDQGTAQVLANGQVLAIGGRTAGVDLYDPATNKWAATGSLMQERTGDASVELPDGRVLVGGQQTSEIYDPMTGKWAFAGAMVKKLSVQTMTPLPSGQALSVGGWDEPTQKATATCAIFALLATGSACVGPECASLHCVDGVCCGTACKELCLACSAAKKGGGADGDCGGIAAGSDPDSECPADMAGSCGRTGTCNGTGACALYDAGTPCGTPACATATLLASACDGLGGCSTPMPKPCFPYACANATACGASCSDNSSCDSGAYCDVGTSMCTPVEATGAPCTDGSQCELGFCVEGVCCDTQCDGLCSACKASNKVSGPDGTCGPAKEGTDPHDDCIDDGATSCKRDGLCDGAGACRDYVNGTACGPTICSDNKQEGAACNGSGSCQANAIVECDPYACESGVCQSTCKTSTDCAANAYCEAGQCKPKKSTGMECTTAESCSTNLCVDKLCCNSPCTGQCEACDTATKGTCLPIAGKPHGARAACSLGAAGQPCSAGACDGIERTSCEGLAGPAVVCRAATCKDGTQTLAATCDGEGSCQDAETLPCEPYRCVGDACGTSCKDNSECVAGATCDKAKSACVSAATCSDHTVTTIHGSVDCSPYRCDGAACKLSCRSVLDCAEPNVCDANNHCVAPDQGDGGDTGGCAVTPRRRPIGAEALALLALAFLALRGRRPSQRGFTGRRETGRDFERRENPPCRSVSARSAEREHVFRAGT
jgi:hypothetical protein